MQDRQDVRKIIPCDKTNTGSERPIGLAKGDFEVPDSFFDPLPDEILHAFTGENGRVHHFLNS